MPIEETCLINDFLPGLHVCCIWIIAPWLAANTHVRKAVPSPRASFVCYENKNVIYLTVLHVPCCSRQVEAWKSGYAGGNMQVGHHLFSLLMLNMLNMTYSYI